MKMSLKMKLLDFFSSKILNRNQRLKNEMAESNIKNLEPIAMGWTTLCETKSKWTTSGRIAILNAFIRLVSTTWWITRWTVNHFELVESNRLSLMDGIENNGRRMMWFSMRMTCHVIQERHWRQFFSFKMAVSVLGLRLRCWKRWWAP